MNKKGFTLIELLVALVIGFAAIMVVGGGVLKALVTIPYVYSEGERTGELVKFSKKGVFFKTWEGQLNTGVWQQGTDGNMTTMWEFSVKSPAVAEALQEILERGGRTTLKYKEYLIVAYRDGETDYIVYDLKVPK
jgi:hypothetical protein